MHEQEWEHVKHFKPDENWGDLSLLKSELVFRLDALRSFIGVPIIIHCAAVADGVGHRPNSQHYEGRAVDCHAEGISVADFALYAMMFRFTGIGINNQWNNPGLHLDIRPLGPYEKTACWIFWTSRSELALDVGELAMTYCKALYDECLLSQTPPVPKEVIPKVIMAAVYPVIEKIIADKTNGNDKEGK